MKKSIGYIVVLLAMATACKKAPLLMYNDIARVQFNDTTTLNATFVYDDPHIVRDTEYIRVNTIGGISDKDRQVKFVQVPEYDYTYVRDPVTNQVTDTLSTERAFKAIPGVHYVDFADPEMQKIMVIHAGMAFDSVPIILLRDTSLKTNSYRLKFELAANDQFGLGETQSRNLTLVFSDKLERFYSWRVDTYVAAAFISFGKYSTGKHQFMIDVLKTNIDESWYQAALAAGAITQYSNVLKQALATFNTNPDNIASGKAPVRETDSPTSPLISF